MKRDSHGRLHQPPGTPIGGEYAPDPAGRAAAPVAINSHQAATSVSGEGFVDADPAQWWGTQLRLAEHHLDPARSFPKMPDDNTPSRGAGRSLLGRRRTYRVRYQGANGLEVRMPSVASVRRHADEMAGATFDIPVTAKTPDGEVAGWVRATRSEQGSWATTPVGFDEGDIDGVRVSEAVAAVLEARRPRSALAMYQDVAERRQERLTAEGVKTQPVQSGWIRRLGYNRETGEMVTVTDSGAGQYGHQVPEEVYNKVVNAVSPGREWTKHVRGRAPHAVQPPCGKCGRFTSATAQHRCPVSHSGPVGESGHHHNAYLAAARMARQPSPTPTGRPVHVLPAQARDWASKLAADVDPRRVKAVETIAAYAGSDRVPRAYSEPTGPLPGRRNGDEGRLFFAGLSGRDATAVAETLTIDDQTARLGDGPTLGEALKSASKHPGTVEVIGRVQADPASKRARTIPDGVYVFDDSPDASTVMSRALNRYGLTTPRKAPAVIEQVEVPWRPGEKAWKLQWSEGARA